MLQKHIATVKHKDSAFSLPPGPQLGTLRANLPCLLVLGGGPPAGRAFLQAAEAGLLSPSPEEGQDCGRWGQRSTRPFSLCDCHLPRGHQSRARPSVSAAHLASLSWMLQVSPGPSSQVCLSACEENTGTQRDPFTARLPGWLSGSPARRAQASTHSLSPLPAVARCLAPAACG